jgi:hypothetical protein
VRGQESTSRSEQRDTQGQTPGESVNAVVEHCRIEGTGDEFICGSCGAEFRIHDYSEPRACVVCGAVGRAILDGR